MPRLLRSASRVILDWLPCVTGFLYVLLSLSRIIALYKGQRSGGWVGGADPLVGTLLRKWVWLMAPLGEWRGVGM